MAKGYDRVDTVVDKRQIGMFLVDAEWADKHPTYMMKLFSKIYIVDCKYASFLEYRYYIGYSSRFSSTYLQDPIKEYKPDEMRELFPILEGKQHEGNYYKDKNFNLSIFFT